MQCWEMETDTLDREAKRLAGELARSGLKELGKRWRCPVGLRTKIVAHARQCRSDGETVADIAFRLGLVESTLGRWLRREYAKEAAVGFRPVSIVPVDSAPDGLSQSRGLTLVAPGGYRVEGLDPESVAYLLRVLS